MNDEYQIQYYGGFTSVNGILWEMEIVVKSNRDITPRKIAFGESPLEIDWAETDKLEPVCGSSATLNLYSDTDRQFVDLYSIAPGAIYMNVLREKKLYWSGALDPELYEEPYSFNDNYTVSLTFSDFAILDRLDWNRTGFMTMRQIIQHCLFYTGIKYDNIITHISTTVFSINTKGLLDDVTILCDNFFDEDNEPMTMREVLEETLRPFGLRIIQKGGNIILYDLNAISTQLTASEVTWENNNAVLGVDKVYNNVKITFSPYEKTTLCANQIDKVSLKDEHKKIAISTDVTKIAKGFDITLYKKGEGITKGDKTCFFNIDPIYSGNEETGVAWSVQTYTASTNSYTSYLNKPVFQMDELIMQTARTYIGNASEQTRKSYKLKISLDLLFDVRYNPFEPEAKGNEEGNMENLKDWCNFSYVPFILNLHTTQGKIFHWENKSVKNSRSYSSSGRCSWLGGPGKWGDAYLAYYDYSNRKSNTGLGGWQQNKPIIGYYRDNLPDSFQKKGAGELIELPQYTGWLELKIGAGVETYDYKSDTMWQIKMKIYDQARWVLYKPPVITLVDSNGKDIKPADIVQNAWLNKSAKEEMSIDTIVGTLPKSSPTALGQLYYSTNNYLINKFYRAGNNDLLERLLIGTIYSNYADRKHTLSGTVALLPQFGIYSDKNQDGKYLLLSEVQYPREDESEIKMVTVCPDNYKCVEFTD